MTSSYQNNMASFVPVVLSGDNLGQKHRHLNALVHEAHSKGFEYGGDLISGERVLDRLLKIDLANKDQNVDYIIKNLKNIETMMLYVKKALKSTWLLQRKDIINPKYLDEVLFREMLLPAVTKMKHWLYINLREPSMCQEFYLYYREKDFEFAVKFLNHCSEEFIVSEVPNVLIKLSPHYLKVLSEKCPKVAKIYFDSLKSNEELRAQYWSREQSYYNSIKCVLKMDAVIFLDITEKYFNMNTFTRLSASQSDYIMKNYKSRFMNKLELYIGYLLHVPTVARRLSVQECEDAVIRLAQAAYLQHWFEYKTVEPLVKRVAPDNRAAFKKRVFVDKDIGECVADWPYKIPVTLTLPDSGPHIFDDQELLGECEMLACGRYFMKRKKYCAYKCVADCMIPTKSELQRLFDEFRFWGFERVLQEVSVRLGVAGSADRRRDMFLVLVSKSGGRSDAVSALLRLAVRHNNEPPHTRAAVLRSLVKRAQVWRIPAEDWQHLLLFAHGLGLDGTPAEAACHEGLHAVVIRQLLAGKCEPPVFEAFLNNFSTLTEYSLSVEERARIVDNLVNILFACAKDAEPALAVKHVDKMLDVLTKYRIRVEPTSPTVQAVMALAKRDADIARPLLERLYDAKIARRELFRMNLKFRRDEAMFLNALRHDPDALDLQTIIEVLGNRTEKFDRFVSKVGIYFGHKEELATQLRNALKEKIIKGQNLKYVRPFASLVGDDIAFEAYCYDIKDIQWRRKVEPEMKACAHRALSHFNFLVDMDPRNCGKKALATRAMCCEEGRRAEIVRRFCVYSTTTSSYKIGLMLSMRAEGDVVLEVFNSVVRSMPQAVLRAAIIYFRRYGEKADLRVWDIVKPVITSIDLSRRKNIRRLLERTEWIPSAIKPDYCATLYPVMDKIAKSSTPTIFRDLMKGLPKVNDESLENVLLYILDSTSKEAPETHQISIFVRYLMLSKDDEDLRRRFDKIGDLFLARMDSLRQAKVANFEKLLNQIMESLKYNAAFFDIKFTCCLTVIQKFVDWMQTFMPKEKYFKQYANLHLTMLYFKAVRQSMKQMPDVFADEKRKKSEGAEVVGFVFGKYIAREVAELVNKYFDSVVELYSDALDDYLNNNFMYGSSRAKFSGAIVKGMFSELEGHQRRMAVYTFNNKHYWIDDTVKIEIEELISKDKGLELFVCAQS